MEGAATSLAKGVKGYWKRRGYEKLNDSSRKSRRRRSRADLPADGSGSKKRLWRIRLTPRLKLKLRRISVKKLLIKLRDGYVNMMLKLANSRFINGGVGGYPGEGVMGFGIRPLKEYDEKIIIGIYRSIILAQGGVPLDAPKVATLHVSSAAETKKVWFWGEKGSQLKPEGSWKLIDEESTSLRFIIIQDRRSSIHI